ncbi:MAG: hypothetical protein MSA09_05235, partial [Lachnospiraceae bacterium]|nr:hypothetical protein [Lachnospiraceae bacterium]
DGKHPDGGLSQKLVIMLVQPFEGGEYDLHAPAGQTADEKIFWEKICCMFHGRSMCGCLFFIRCNSRVS